MKRPVEHLALLTLLFTLLAAALYWPTRGAGFVTDYTSLIEKLDRNGAAGILTSYGFPALQPLLNLGHYLLYKINGGPTGWLWGVAYVALHVCNAVLLYTLLYRLIPARGYRGFTALAAALLFLVIPYQSEVVVWKVTLNYLLSTALVLGALQAGLSYREQGRRPVLFLVLLLQTAALLTFELSITLPFLTICLLATRQNPRRIGILAGLQLALVGTYFIAMRLLLGTWVGHYGANVHTKLPLEQMAADLWRYVFKLLLFTRNWPQEAKTTFNAALTQPWLYILLYVLAVALGIWLWRRGGIPRLAVRFAAAAAIALGPVLNLYFNELLYIENDRYGYLASAFIYVAPLLGLTALPRRVGWLLAAAWITIAATLLWRTNGYWQASNRVYWALLANFDPGPAREVYLLNLPDNLQGAVMFRSYEEQPAAFTDALRYVARRPYDGAVHLVAQYNLTAPDNGVVVDTTQDSTWTVAFRQYGNWWWRGGFGATDYEKPTYDFRLGEWGGYVLHWHVRPDSALVLVQDGMEWRQIQWAVSSGQ